MVPQWADFEVYRGQSDPHTWKLLPLCFDATTGSKPPVGEKQRLNQVDLFIGETKSTNAAIYNIGSVEDNKNIYDA